MNTTTATTATHAVRVLDAHGEVVDYTDHGTNWATAFENFTQTAMDSEPGFTVQLLVDGDVDEELYVEPTDA